MNPDTTPPMPLWQPDSGKMTNSQMFAFLGYINRTHSLKLQNYNDLYHWSIKETEAFWAAIWDFCQVIFSEPYTQILKDPEKMPGAQWFIGSKLNFAENLLRYRDEKTALIFCNERGARQSLSYSQLYQAVCQTANALKNLGVNTNDRVAALMPNLPETIIAMLATSSLGAIWSSCSPDFGEAAILDRFNQIHPKILFTTDGYHYNGKTYHGLDKLSNISQNLPSVEKVIVVPYLNANPDIHLIPKAIHYHSFQETQTPELTFAPLPFDHPLYILYSSGTTGVPKCLVHGAGGVLLQHLKELKLHTDLTRTDVFFYYTTCGWMMWNWLVSGLSLGATLVLYDGSPFYPSPKTLFNLIDQEKISVFGVSAKYLSAVEKFNLYPKKTHSLASLRSILSTGSPLLPSSFEYVYQKIKTDVCLSSISGGTDIVSCFALGNPLLPVYSGELQCRGLGLAVEVWNESGKSVIEEKGELVCTAPFPAMPIYFWNDLNHRQYHEAYFSKFPGVWAHGDFAEVTQRGGMILYGRSDALLKPGGVRIGTAEIYRQIEKIPSILESLVIGQEWAGDTRIVLFVKLIENQVLTETLQTTIKTLIRQNASPHHVPAKIIAVPDIPKTLNGKIVELAVREVVHGRKVKNQSALANPESLNFFKDLAALKT